MEDNTAAEARQDGDAGPPADEEGYSDDALATMAEAYAEQADHLFRLSHGARADLLHRLVTRKAKVLDTPNWRGKVKAGLWTHRVENPDRLRERLVSLVSADALEAAFVRPAAKPPPLRVDQRGLNDLVALGGEVAAVIAEERVSQQGDPVLVLERKPTVDEERGKQDDARPAT